MIVGGHVRGNDIAKHATRNRAHDQSSRAIGTATIITAVLTAVDPLVPRQLAFAIPARIFLIIAVGIIAAIIRIGSVIVILAPRCVRAVIAAIAGAGA
jgi:hypothetical protein